MHVELALAGVLTQTCPPEVCPYSSTYSGPVTIVTSFGNSDLTFIESFEIRTAGPGSAFKIKAQKQCGYCWEYAGCSLPVTAVNPGLTWALLRDGPHKVIMNLSIIIPVTRILMFSNVR